MWFPNFFIKSKRTSVFPYQISSQKQERLISEKSETKIEKIITRKSWTNTRCDNSVPLARSQYSKREVHTVSITPPLQAHQARVHSKRQRQKSTIYDQSDSRFQHLKHQKWTATRHAQILKNGLNLVSFVTKICTLRNFRICPKVTNSIRILKVITCHETRQKWSFVWLLLFSNDALTGLCLFSWRG